MVKGYLTALLLCVGWILPAQAQDKVFERVHAIAMHGDPKYPAGFTHFDYVNPNAPKGGSVRLSSIGTFDTFNPFIPKGNAAGASGAALETLMVGSADEAFTQYGLLAEAVTYPEDRSWITFHLRPEARWHDGMPVTPADVIFSFNVLREKGRPFYRFYYGNVESVEATGEHDVTFRFAGGENRELPLIIGQLNVMPAHYWKDRDFTKTTLEPPLGSGPYRITKFEAGRYTIVERVEDYWGHHVAVNVGIDNFDKMRTDYYRDRTVVREAVKAGDIDFFQENTAKSWAQDYNTDAIRDGLLIKEAIEHKRPAGLQAFIMNLRKPVFQDIRVRKALAYAFDFEWSNKNLFFGQYTRSTSFFANSELASFGLPSDAELKILEPFRDQIAPEVFEKEYAPPKTDGSGRSRRGLRTASKLLTEAGYEVRDLQRVHTETGEQLKFEFLLRAGGAFRRIVLPMQQNLKRLGIEMTIREVDDAQYVNRIRARDFDIISLGWGQSDSPGNEQRAYWGSEAADLASSQNYSGIKDPVLDELIEKVISAPSREDLVIRTRALDRVLLSHHFVVPNWHLSKDRILYWNKFGRPSHVAERGTSFARWWIDPEKEAALKAATGDQAN